MLRRSTSQRARDHRRSHKGYYSLALHLLCLVAVGVTVLVTLDQLSSAWNPGDGPHLQAQGCEAGEPIAEARGGATLGQRLGRLLAPWRLGDANGARAFDIPRVVSKRWCAPKRCGTIEEMGAAATGDTGGATLRMRATIKKWVRAHGADAVRSLPGSAFCQRRFVMGLASDDGFGNNMYKLLSAAGLALMLNRSLIIGERGANTPSYVGDGEDLALPFGEYLVYSTQAFSMREVKRLWARHECGRAMTMRVDDIEHGPGRSKSLCDDWTSNRDTILWFKGAMDTVGLQFLLKNQHAAMRRAAAAVLGHPAVPSSRPNAFGELLREFVTPSVEIQAAVEWALQGGPAPDFAVHLRLRHNRSNAAPAAALDCLAHIVQKIEHMPRKKVRVVVISDTPGVFDDVHGEGTEVIRFDYKEYVSTFRNLSAVMSLRHGQPPRSKLRDWGEMPRWVSVVDFFLAARAKVAVVSAASERICTTYAQLVGALAAASTLSEDPRAPPPCALFSSFHPGVGLAKQSGWGHAWRTFGGRLGCRNQGPQCARTPLMAYAWWDAPWQSPTRRDVLIMRAMGVEVDEVGNVSEASLDQFCEAHQRIRPVVYNCKLPAL